MIRKQLTAIARPAILPPMRGNGFQRKRSGRRAARAGWLMMGSMFALSGCVSVAAPDKPIVIELNINIKQEVVYKLDKGVGDLIDQNSGIF